MAATQKPSDEADARQLRMASAEGKAYAKSLSYMATKVADNGAEKRAGDYIVGIAQERAEGMYHMMAESSCGTRRGTPTATSRSRCATLQTSASSPT